MSKFAALRPGILLILTTALSTGCAARAAVSIEKLYDPPCSGASGIAWAGPRSADDRARLSAWCQSVGSVVVRDAKLPPVEINTSGLTIVSWNQHEDYGDLERLLGSMIGKSPVILLLQEVARTSDSVPAQVPSTVRVPDRINPQGPMKQNIEAIAGKFDLFLAYLPSMPNGRGTGEDRGCAILSTLPISDVLGIELPWVAQRRVAILATVTAMKDAVPWQMRVVSVHLDNRSGRWRQAASIADFLDREDSLRNLPMVIGGDLNTLYGIKDRAVSELEHIAPLVRECGDRATFRFRFWFGLRLDHFFTTLPPEARSGCDVERDPFGSDHYPIVLKLFGAEQNN